jgi:hypothetical protein
LTKLNVLLKLGDGIHQLQGKGLLDSGRRWPFS